LLRIGGRWWPVRLVVCRLTSERLSHRILLHRPAAITAAAVASRDVSGLGSGFSRAAHGEGVVHDRRRMKIPCGSCSTACFVAL
jgi:hypothetical protein